MIQNLFFRFIKFLSDISNCKAEISFLRSKNLHQKNDLLVIIIYSFIIFIFAMQSGYFLSKDEQGVFSEDIKGVSSEDIKGVWPLF